MLTFSTYFIIVFILIIANSIPVFGSSRTRRFASKPSLFFILLAGAFVIIRLIGFLTYDMKPTQLKQNDASFDIKKIRGKIITKEDGKKEEATYVSENALDSNQKKFYEHSNFLLKFATVQALLVVLLSYLGMKKFQHRKAYYQPKLWSHLVYFGICLLLTLFVF
jgi:hypothetical protein